MSLTENQHSEIEQRGGKQTKRQLWESIKLFYIHTNDGWV